MAELGPFKHLDLTAEEVTTLVSGKGYYQKLQTASSASLVRKFESLCLDQDTEMTEAVEKRKAAARLRIETRRVSQNYV